MEDQPSIRDDSEALVSESRIEVSPVNLDNAPNSSPAQPTAVTTQSTSIFRFLSRLTNLNPIVTDCSRRVTSIEPLITQSREELLVNLREETEAAELRAKLALADEVTVLARRNTKLLDLEALELDRKCNLLRKPRSPPPQLPGSPSMPTPSADVLGGFLAFDRNGTSQARRSADGRGKGRPAGSTPSSSGDGICRMPGRAPSSPAGSYDCLATCNLTIKQLGATLSEWR